MQKDSSKKWLVWCLTTHDAAWYMLEPSRSAATIGGVLDDFEGVVMCDAYAAYNTLAKGSNGRLRLAHCFAHARELPQVDDLEGEAKIVALELRRLRRDTESRAIALKLKAWAGQQTALPRSALAEASATCWATGTASRPSSTIR